LKYLHELLIHVIQSASATASHLGLAEIGCDHVSHEQPGGNNECAA
jgi:hypothetical protein